MKLAQELAICDETIKETHHAVIILNSLPQEFDILKDVIAYARDDITYKKNAELIGSIRTELLQESLI